MAEKKSPKKTSDKSAKKQDASARSSAPPAQNTGNEHPENRHLLVGIGCSAGGLEAMNTFLDNLPGKNHCTVFIVQHQSRTSDEDILASILQKHSQRPITTAKNNTTYEEGRIYVCPPGKFMALSQGRIRISKQQDSRQSLDYFLRSLAKEGGERSVAVVLSGSNTDGTLGARMVREHGGLVIAEDPQTAEFSTMPGSLVDNGLAHDILAPGDMPDAILEYARNIEKLLRKKDTKVVSLPAPLRNKLSILLKNRTGMDISQYKDKTVNRRIFRRMAFLQIDGFMEYLDYVRSSKKESEELLQDLLIGVTEFFRDPDAFEELKNLLINDYLDQSVDKELRAWVPGCATGEEAYSLAIIIHEAMETTETYFPVTVLATDMDHQAIETARRGIYAEGIEDYVNKKRLKRFFVRNDGTYQVKTVIRDMVVFADQNLLMDPPFSNLDIICCRNLLMYFKPEAQRQVLARFSYGLKPGGLLFLGLAENTSVNPDAFSIIHKKWRIYKRNPEEPKSIPIHKISLGRVPARNTLSGQKQTRVKEQPDSLRQVARNFLLRRCTPPSVMVNKNGETFYIHGRTGKYLEPAQGEPHVNVLEMAREGLRFELYRSLSAANAKKEDHVPSRVKVKTNDHTENVDIYVRPVDSDFFQENLFMVSFVKAPQAVQECEAAGEEDKKDPRVRELEQILEERLNDMQAMAEEYEATHEQLTSANEELQSTNEELQSTNEELKSTNEELETSKEELQSINEEQTTLNMELQAKNSELLQIKDDMNNLMSSTNIATLFLDGELNIKNFTPAMTEIMNLRDMDVGRPVEDISLRLEDVDLKKWSKQVLEDLSPVTREVRKVTDGESTWFQLTINPYRTLDNVIDGVVMTFTDITNLKNKEQEAKSSQLLAESVINTVKEPLVILDTDLNVTSVNREFLQIFKTKEKETLGRKIYELGNGQWDIPDLKRLLEEVIPRREEVREYEVEHEFPKIGSKRMCLNAMRLETGGQDVKILLSIYRIEDR